ncbi:DUF1206 domain-containing protein [Streptomyces sp. TRM66268-LWL]|uniref:DUF1206 domain-containing protein n=1 Tax=Streptomyces polyasparticus TaxID=2767826 RepID=A0ABR7SEE8_9ACTN|nr:DUF1206 domain-containing protein [Streptomyces polyasparticus]MBC9713354.1 DUF1206 domain-containing protein [Streptomyces polyasparticus]
MVELSRRARRLGRRADNSDWVDRAAGLGLIAYGVVHLVVGWLAVQLAVGDHSGEASPTGAIGELADRPYGAVIVWATAVGLYLLVIWQLIEAAAGHRFARRRTWKRLLSGCKAIVYGALGTSALKVALGSGAQGNERKTDDATARLMDLPAGQALVAAVGAVIIGIGVNLLRLGFTDKFLKSFDGKGRSGTTGTAYTWLGRVGHVAKGLALCMVGVLFGWAALTHDPDRSGGLDAALREVLSQPFGPALLTVIGLGFCCYGLYCFAWARHLDR